MRRYQTIEQVGKKLIPKNNGYNRMRECIMEGEHGERAYSNGHMLLANCYKTPEKYIMRSLKTGEPIKERYPKIENVIPKGLKKSFTIPEDFYQYLKPFKHIKKTQTKVFFYSDRIYISDGDDDALMTLTYEEKINNPSITDPIILNAYQISILQPGTIRFDMPNKPIIVDSSYKIDMQVYSLIVMTTMYPDK